MLLLDICHVVVRITGVLVFNPPTLPVWATWFLLIIRTVVVVVLFRRNIAPFMLARLSRRIRARSISPRSIKGLYFRSRGRTWRIERIGWAFHPWGESRLSVKIEGLHLEIAEPPIRRNRASFQRSSTPGNLALFVTIRDAIAFALERVSTFNWIHVKASSASIIVARLFVRCLPSLTQNLDFELDSAVISFPAVLGAHVMIKSVTLCTKVDLSQLGTEAETFTREKDDHGPSSWNLFSNADRFWDRLWGQTQAYCSVDFTVNELGVYTLRELPILSSRQSSLLVGCRARPVFDAYSTDPQLPSDTVIHTIAPLRFVTSFQFTPKLLAVQHQSVDCSLDIPSIDVSANGIRSLMNFIKSAKKNGFDTGHCEDPLASSTSLGPSVLPQETTYLSPLPASPTSPTSPFLNAFSQITRRVRSGSVSPTAPSVRRLKDPVEKTFVSLFRSIRFRLSSISVAYDDRSVDMGELAQAKYVASVDGLSIDVSLSDPREHMLHRKWLGSGVSSVFDETKFSISCHLASATLQRSSFCGMDTPVRLLALCELNMDVLTNNWPQPWIPACRMFPGNPNSSFVACEVSLTSLDLFDRLDQFCATILTTPPAKSSATCRSMPALLPYVPRIELQVVCGNIQARVACADKDMENTSILNIQTTGFNIGLSTAYRAINPTASRDNNQTSDSSAIQMDYTCHMSLQPLFARVRRARGLENGWERVSIVSSLEAGAFYDDPLVGLDRMELIATGHTLGHLGYAELAVLQPCTTMLDIKCINEGASIDLWKAEYIQLLRTLLDAFESLTVQRHDTHPSPPSEAFYPGVSFHLAVGCLTSIVTAKDINPTCDLQLSRGLALRTGFSLQYSCMQASRHSSRANNRVSAARSRHNLGLSEDLVMQSIAIANAGHDSDVSALVQGTTWRTTCRTATSTQYAACDNYDVNREPVSGQLQEGGFIFIPGSLIRVRFRRRQPAVVASEPGLEETCEISAEVPHVVSRLDLLNAYSVLLAVHTLHSLAPRTPRTTKLRSGISLPTVIRLRVENMQIFCQLPLREKLFIRVLSSSLEWTPSGMANANCRSVVAWVPSVQFKGKWEELLHFRHLLVTLTTTREVILSLAADGFRLVIPHRYMLSELVLNFGLTVKSLRHLRRTVESGHYTAMDAPVAEPPKNLPKIVIRVQSLALEAADSPFEAKLGLIWKTGFQAQKVRVERELAFEAKLRAILASGDPEASSDAISQSGLHYHFTSKRTTSVADARTRLNMIHSSSWLSSISRQKEDLARKEDYILRKLRHSTHKTSLHVPMPIPVYNPEKGPPLLRAVVSDLVLTVSRPDLPEGYTGFLDELGKMPHSTEYSLLIPMHLELNLKGARVNLRDYRLPLANVPFNVDGPSLEFVTNLIIAEEMGDADSVEWLQCPIYQQNTGIVGANSLYICVPKTIMPVKSYASPDIHFRTPEVTDFTWGVSYNPAIQEVMRVIETLSHPPRDPSPAIGFWDKIRLVFHWRINARFKGGARLHFKGSRDPYHIVGVGAGFDFCWNGNVAIKIGYANDENELIQLTSDSMVITIPNHEHVPDETMIGNLSEQYLEGNNKKELSSSTWENRKNRKVCAKFNNGIRWGVGITLERTCGMECTRCRGDNFNRECRFFTFIPHHQIVLRTVDSNPHIKDRDSYSRFRSNFIHFSTSLTSPLVHDGHSKHNSFHLTPKTFAHFWSWWHLFDGALSLPIRQGHLFPDSRPPSKKFGRHLATIKYRISFSPLHITHVYKIDGGDAWSAGESHCVGVKAFIERFQADMHQREEETSKPSQSGHSPKVVRHKPFSAAEVVITGLDLRALFAVFSEPQKKTIPLKDSLPGTENFWRSLPAIPLSSDWVNVDDFVELDWSPSDQKPNIYLLEAASCPRFVYFKRSAKAIPPKDDNGVSQARLKTKFGEENSHYCLIGKEPTAQEVQLKFGAARLAELRAHLADSTRNTAEKSEPLYHDKVNTDGATQNTSLAQMIALLERYTRHLSHLCSAAPGTAGCGPSEDLYDMPVDIKLPHIGEFVNVYQVHCPKIMLTSATRNILQQYYLASRARRGFEYHMSTRAVKFIRDQAHLTLSSSQETQSSEKKQRAAAGAQAAAQAVRRILTGEERHSTDDPRRAERQRSHSLSNIDPLFGWDKGVSEQKAHLCLLLKPQIVLRSDSGVHRMLVLAADHVVLRNHGILDTLNVDDPVSGYVMQRNYADLNSLQMFQPVEGSSADHLPLEVFVDFRCESRDFDRLVPQTHATLRYDKFNRLRLRNNVTSVAVSSQNDDMDMIDHLLHETDLIVVQVPRFSVSADASAFASMSDVVTNLLLSSDPVHKARMTQLETMLFSYNFNDLGSAAKVVADLQSRIRHLIRIEGKLAHYDTNLDATDQHDLLASKAHILALSQELNLIFEAIKLAQHKTDGGNQEKKSALRLQASSSEISWQMIDENRELLAKLAVRGIDYSWLSRQDSSSANRMNIRDLQAFDGSASALWPEILAKDDDPPNHQMIRRGVFAEAEWSVLAPVGGISIYDYFGVKLHPIRLALETQLGNNLLDYLVPGRRSRREAARSEASTQEAFRENASSQMIDVMPLGSQLTTRPPSDPALAPPDLSTSMPQNQKGRLVPSRSFSSLRSAAVDSRSMEYHLPGIPKSRSSTALVDQKQPMDLNDTGMPPQDDDTPSIKPEGDASEMRQRSAQKTFVHVKISSVNVLLSVMKGRSFLVRDARLRTHDLEWRNRTWSFEELINQFIPSDPSWKGWVRVAWQQHVFSVGGVVKELITKTQWSRMGKNLEVEDGHPSKSSSRRVIGSSPEERLRASSRTSPEPSTPPKHSDLVKITGHKVGSAAPRSRSRTRMGNLFRRPGDRKTSTDSAETVSPRQMSATDLPGRHGSDADVS